MTRSHLVALMFSLQLVYTTGAFAQSPNEACATLVNVRSSLYSMISAKEKSAQDTLNTKVQASSAKLDSILAAMTGAEEKRAAEFKIVWDQFKTTRDGEIIPALHNGNAKEAKRIADGIQLQRLSKMWKIMSCKAR